MTQEVTNDDDYDERCPDCGAVLSDEDVTTGFDEGDYTKYDCPECGEVTIEETMASKAQRIADGEVDPEEVFAFAGTDRRSTEERQESYDQMNEPLEVEVDEEITGEKGTCDNPECDETEDLKVTRFGTHLCPDHHKGEEA